MYKSLHYLIMTFVIALGVALGILVSDYLKARYTAYQLEKLTIETKQKLNDQNRAKAEEQRAIDSINKQLRTKSSIAIKLNRQCKDWKQMNGIRDGETSRSNMKLYCDAYLNYIKTGEYDRKLIEF